MRDIKLGEFKDQLSKAVQECGKDSEVFFKFDNDHQFIIKGVYVSKCDCCDQKLPLIYGEMM